MKLVDVVSGHQKFRLAQSAKYRVLCTLYPQHKHPLPVIPAYAPANTVVSLKAVIKA